MSTPSLNLQRVTRILGFHSLFFNFLSIEGGEALNCAMYKRVDFPVGEEGEGPSLVSDSLPVACGTLPVASLYRQRV